MLLKFVNYFSNCLIISLGFYFHLSVGLVFNTILAPGFGLPINHQAAQEGEKILLRSLSKLENFWLKDGRFLVGSSQPSIADISLVCEIMQFEVNDIKLTNMLCFCFTFFWLKTQKIHVIQFLSEKDRDRILNPYKKVLQWMEDTKSATAPHFDEVHGLLFKAQKKFRERMATESGKNELKSKL